MSFKTTRAEIMNRMAGVVAHGNPSNRDEADYRVSLEHMCQQARARVAAAQDELAELEALARALVDATPNAVSPIRSSPAQAQAAVDALGLPAPPSSTAKNLGEFVSSPAGVALFGREVGGSMAVVGAAATGKSNMLLDVLQKIPQDVRQQGLFLCADPDRLFAGPMRVAALTEGDTLDAFGVEVKRRRDAHARGEKLAASLLVIDDAERLPDNHVPIVQSLIELASVLRLKVVVSASSWQAVQNLVHKHETSVAVLDDWVARGWGHAHRLPKGTALVFTPRPEDEAEADAPPTPWTWFDCARQ